MTTAIYGTSSAEYVSSRSIEGDSRVSLDVVNRHLLLNNSLAALDSVSGAAPAAAPSDWDPSKLNEAWADMEAGGLCALLNRLVASGQLSPTDPFVLSLKNRLSDLVAHATKLDDSLKTIAQAVLDKLNGPNPVGDLKSYWVATTSDGKSGPITLVFQALDEVLKSDPGDMYVQDGDDGFGLLCATSLFADYGAAGTDKLSNAMNNYFIFYDGGIADGSYLYARQMAYYLSRQGLTADEMNKVHAAFSYTSAFASYTDFCTQLDYYFTKIEQNGGTWPSSLGDPADVEGDADSLWDNFAGKQ